ncbi:MAG: class E sortase [Lapillicoccus sp.]
MRGLRSFVGVLGEIFVTAGVVLILFVVWQLGFVALVEGNRQAGTVQALEKQFAAPVAAGTSSPASPSSPSSPASPSSPSSPASPAEGSPTSPVVGPSSPTGPTGPGAAPPAAPPLADGAVFGIVRIPRLGGPTWAKPVYQGVGLDVLAKGLGHYSETQMPGEVGNVAIAGHRAGHGNPLIDIDAIRVGDVMVIETQEAYFVYRAQRYQIVAPTAVDVLAPEPQQPGVQPSRPWLTLTSCNPRYGSTERYIVFAAFERRIPRSEGLPPDLLADPRKTA